MAPGIDVDALRTLKPPFIRKAVNYEAQPNTLLVRLRGSAVPEKATVRAYTLTAGLTDAPSLEQPRKIHPVETTLPHARTLTSEMRPYSVGVVEIVADRSASGAKSEYSARVRRQPQRGSSAGVGPATGGLARLARWLLAASGPSGLSAFGHNRGFPPPRP
jgi:hypothetical protein